MQAFVYNSGKVICSNWYIHLIQQVSDAPEFYLLAKSKFNISELYCICKECQIKFKLCFLGLMKIVCECHGERIITT
jgi:hypothetical protein